MKENRAILEKQTTYHESVFRAAKDVLSHLARGEEYRNQDPWRGIGTTRFSEGAYQSALTTQVLSKLEVKTLLAVSEAYAAQEHYHEISNNAMLASINRELLDYKIWNTFKSYAFSNG